MKTEMLDNEVHRVSVIRATGGVINSCQDGMWFRSGRLAGRADQLRCVIFVPEEMDETTFPQYSKNLMQIPTKFALGMATIHLAGN